jgi:probable HAF family extracellular repeat protein
MVKSFPMKIRWTGTAAIMLTLLLAFTARLKAQTYVPIIYPGSVATEAHGINAFGQIVGTWTDSGGNTHGFLFSAGTYTSLDYPGSIDTVPWGINNAGDIVGYHDNNVGFFLKGGVFTALSSAGLDINNVELIATPGGLIDLNGGFIIIDYPGSLTTNPEAISDAFQTVGDYTDSVNNPHGFSYNAISYTTIDVPGEAVTFLQGVNVPGQIVGYFYDSFARPHAFLDNGGTFTNFDYPGITDYTFAYHINDFGQIVGRAFVPGNPGYIGFLRTPAAINPVPHIHQALFPDSSAPGSAGFTLTVEGTGFVQGAVVNWNGSSRSTSFQNSERLTTTINASDVAAAGTALVTVVNPTPGGGTSNTQFFSITSPVLTPTFNSSTLTAGASPQRNIAADFNGDGIMDLAVADGTNNQILVMLGNGDGTFQSPVPYQVGAGPSTLVAGDFDGDGKLDIAVGDSDTGIYVLQGNGDGTFHVDPIISVAELGPWDLAVGDFNGDGKLDLACVNQTAGTISIFLGNGDATFNGDGFFQPPATVATNAGPGQMTIGDFNGDGILDMAVANFGSFAGDTVSVFLGNGNGTFQPKVDYDTSLAPLSVVAADFNGDGKLDLAVADSCGTSTPCGRPGLVSILLGNGDGTFQPHVDYPAGSFPYTIVAGDFNGDGKLDVAVSDLDSFQVTILAGVGDGTFQPSSVLSTSGSPVGLLAADFNRDGLMDFAVGTGSGVNIQLQYSSTTTTITLTPAVLSFGNEGVDVVSAAKTVTMTNTGTAVLNFSSISSTVDFGIDSATCGATLAPKAKCTVKITFEPAALGAVTGSLTFADNAGNSPQTLSLTGTGVAQATLTPPSATFAKQAIDTTSSAKLLTLTNNLPTPLSFSISLTGADPGDFASTTSCGSSVPAKGKCTISVKFTPQAAGTRTATLTVTDGANNSPQTVSLTGTGEVPVTWTPTALTFPLQPIATTSAAKVVTLTNNQPTPLSIGLSVTGANPGDFAPTSSCGGTVPANGKCMISVTFTPSATGSRTATLNVTDAASNSPQTVSLTGSGEVQVAYTPTSLTFAPQTVGTTSAPKIVTITNNLPTALSIQGYSLTGAASFEYPVVNTCGTSVPAKSKCTISFAFSPQSTGPQPGSYGIFDSANNSPQYIALNGTGK